MLVRIILSWLLAIAAAETSLDEVYQKAKGCASVFIGLDVLTTVMETAIEKQAKIASSSLPYEGIGLKLSGSSARKDLSANSLAISKDFTAEIDGARLTGAITLALLAEEDGLPRASLEVTWGGCSSQKCSEMGKALKASMNIEAVDPTRFFDLASSMRTFKGITDFLRVQVGRDPAHSDFKILNNGALVMLNCTIPSQKALLESAKEQEPRAVDFGGTQNFFSLIAPLGVKRTLLDFAYHIDYLDYMDKKEFDEPHRPQFASLKDMKVSFLQDEDVFKQMDLGHLPEASLSAVPTDIFDDAQFQKMHEVDLKQNYMVELINTESNDRAILPVTLYANARMASRNGVTYQFVGPSQEVALNRNNLNITIHPCHFISGSKMPDAKDAEDDEDDDFDDADDEEESTSFKLSNEVRLACSALPNYNKDVPDRMKVLESYLFEFLPLNRLNTYFGLKEIEPNFDMLCAHAMFKQPFFRIENGRLMLRFQMADSFVNIDHYCDNADQQMKYQHPAIISGNTTFIDRMKATEEKGEAYFWFDDLRKEEWWGLLNFRYPKYFSPWLHMATTFEAYRALCQSEYPQIEETACATTYWQSRPLVTYDRLTDNERIYVDYKEGGSHEYYESLRDQLSRMTLYSGTLFYLMGVNIPQKVLLPIVFGIDFAISSISLLKPFDRYGFDTDAYFVQSHSWLKGDSNYTRLSSAQGPTFYPPGHLYHYAMVVKLMELSERFGTVLFRALNTAVHSGVVITIGALAFMLFRKTPSTAQLICFMLAANDRIRILNEYAFNDNLLLIYAALAFYFLAKGRPLLASLMFSLSLSIKTGIYMAAPPFFGMIHYGFGPRKLILSIFVILSFQVLLALPFTWDPAAKLLGYSQGAHTTIKEFFFFSNLIPGQKGKTLFAFCEVSYIWTFLPCDIYDAPFYKGDGFLLKLQPICLLVHVYYFFFVQGTLGDCIMNLLKFKKPKFTFRSRQKAIESLVVLTVISVNFLPGIHVQYQMWYTDFLPIFLALTGLPLLAIPLLYQDVFPHIDWAIQDNRLDYLDSTERSVFHIVLMIVSVLPLILRVPQMPKFKW